MTPFYKSRLLGLCAGVGFIALSVSGCAVNPATGEQTFTAFSTEEDEIAIGRQNHQALISQYKGVYDDKELAAYVDSVGQRLAKVSEMPHLQWTFTILDDPIINAFATSGGYVYISRGILALMESEAELAAVLGHEIGHITALHVTQKRVNSTITGIGAVVLGAVLGPGADQLANIAGQTYLAGYSRAKETEADELGLRYMERAGYELHAATTFFEKLAKESDIAAKESGQTGSHYSLLSSHPETKQRIQHTKELADKSANKGFIQNREAHLKAIDGIHFGDTPKFGTIIDNGFFLPTYKVKFSVPKDFILKNGDEAVIAYDKDNLNASVVFNLEKNIYATYSPHDFLRDRYAGKLKLNNLEEIEINGLKAATANARVNTKNGERDARYVMIFSPEYIYKLTFLTEPKSTTQYNEDFRRITYSLEQMNEREIATFKGLEVGIFEVTKNAKKEDFVQKMRISNYAEDWFNALNNEALKDGLQTGEKVKVITVK